MPISSLEGARGDIQRKEIQVGGSWARRTKDEGRKEERRGREKLAEHGEPQRATESTSWEQRLQSRDYPATLLDPKTGGRGERTRRIFDVPKPIARGCAAGEREETDRGDATAAAVDTVKR